MDLPVLPQDVIDEIISQVDENDASTLKSCSLVCRSFRRKAQKMLFNPRAVVVNLVNGDNSPSEPTNIVLIVKHAPHLIGYIEDLVISGLSIDHYPLDDATDLVDALSVFSRKGEFSINLEYLSLENLSWSYIDPQLQHALVLLMTVSSLRSIYLENVMDCPANLVLPPLLKYLSLEDITFSSLLSPTIRKELPKLESLSVTFFTLLEEPDRALDKFPDVVERIVDMTQLKTFEGGDYTPYTMPLFEQILRSTSNSLEQITLEQIKDPDSISLDFNQFPRLTDIIIDQFCDSEDCILMFILITKTMKKISYRNVIQNISFCLSLGRGDDIADFELAMNEYGVWQELDTICSIPQLASSKSFRGITFSMESSAFDCDKFPNLMRNKLPKTRKAHKLHIEAPLI